MRENLRISVSFRFHGCCHGCGPVSSGFRASLTQKKIYDLGVTSLRVFGGLEESREEVRAVSKSDFGLDPVSNIEIRKEVSKLLRVWESARMQLKCQEQNRQDAKLGVQQWLVQNTEYAAMRAAVETLHGRSLKDCEVPSKSLIAVKLEQVEDGAPTAEDLREVTSLEDAHVEAYGAVIDPAWLRIRPGKATTTPPATPEELRLRRRRLGLAWDFVRSRHSTRTWRKRGGAWPSSTAVSFYLAAVEELLRLRFSGDPDSRAFFSSSVSFAKEVRLGPGVRLPRVPAVFEKKDKWRQHDESENMTRPRQARKESSERTTCQRRSMRARSRSSFKWKRVSELWSRWKRARPDRTLGRDLQLRP